MATNIYDVAIIGGGASGLICALQCAKNSQSVVILEQNQRIGKKIIASGNGRCNLTNQKLSSNNFNSDFVSYAIEQFDCDYIINYFKSLGLLTRIEDDRVYPYSESSGSVLNIIMQNLSEYNVDIYTSCCIKKIHKNKNFILVGEDFEFKSKNVIVATGSRATFGKESYNLLKDFGHNVTPLQPAMTTLLCEDFKSAKGVRAKVNAMITIDEIDIFEEKGEMLFKEDGISGILTFKLSSFYARALVKDKNSKCSLTIDFAPDYSLDQLKQFILENNNPRFLLQGILHTALCQIVLSKTIMDKSLLMSETKAYNIAKTCKNFVVDIGGLGGIANAQVVSGGMQTSQFDPKTMQSKLCSGLYAIGEVLDVDGECGGYNLHWAWASALLTAQSLRDYDKN